MPDPPDKKMIRIPQDKIFDQDKINDDANFKLIRDRLKSVVSTQVTKQLEEKDKFKCSLTLVVKVYKLTFNPGGVMGIGDDGFFTYEQDTYYATTKVLQINKANLDYQVDNLMLK